MPYTYKYVPSGSAIDWTAKESYRNLLQEDLNQMFYEASNVYEIEEETVFGSGVYQKVDVRVNGVVDTQTGERQSDDFRKLTFKEIDHSVDLGRQYKFSENTWIAITVDKIGTFSTSTNIRRCNNTLRWIDTQGAYHSLPCSIGYLIKENRDYSTAGSQMVVPSGMIEVLIQGNPETRTLKPNQRFLFGSQGQWVAYRIEGGGFNNFNNTETLNNNSAGLMRLSLAVDFINEETDDLVNGVADSLEWVYSLTLNQDTISGNAGQMVQLQATVTVNQGVVSRTIDWSSDDTSIATVNSSGLVTFISEGTCTITASLHNNTTVKDTCGVSVGASPVDNYQVVYSPTKNYVLEGETQVWTIYLYKNGVQQADVFTFSLDAGTVPIENYTCTVLGNNSFGISNLKMFLTDTLDVTCTSGVYSVVLSISLRGAW